jgi:predicted membrane protein
VWAIVLPPQAVVIRNENADDITWQHVPLNAPILAGGAALNRLAARLARQRRRVRGTR